MSMKTTCPGCDSHTSAVYEAVREGEPCPYCGLPAATIVEVNDLRKRREDDDLTERLSAALLRAGMAEGEVRRLRSTLDAVERAMKGHDSED